MTGKHLLGAASVALFIAASSAQAADVTPILAAGVPPVAAVEKDPTVSLEVENWTQMEFNGFDLYNYTTIEGTIDWASGWHFEIDEIEFGADLGGFGAEGNFLFYRSIGNFEVGVGFGGGAGCNWDLTGCGGDGGVSAFVAYEYDDDRLFFRSELWFGFWGFYSDTEFDFDVTDQFNVWAELEIDGGGFDDLDVDFTYAVTDQLNIWADLDWDFDPMIEFDNIQVGFEYDVTDQFYVWAYVEFEGGFEEFEIGGEYDVTDSLMVGTEFEFWGVGNWEVEVYFEYDVTDSLEIWAEVGFNDGGFGYVEVGAELEQQVGTGPFTLLAETKLRWDGGLDEFWVGFGFGYTIGGN